MSYTKGLDHEAPEVVRGDSDLIAVKDNAANSPQVVQQFEPMNYISTRNGSNYAPLNNYEPEEKISMHSGGGGGGHTNGAVGTDPSNPSRRKRWVWIGVGAVLLALAIALGVGLGVGLSQSRKESSNTGAASDNTTASSSTVSGDATTTSTATTSAVTSGTSGLAQFSCNSTETTESSNGTDYIQECYTQYAQTKDMYGGNVTIKNLGGKLTVYTFRACLDECDKWNKQGGDPPCRAVSYYANLTAPINEWGGNCFIKNSRGGQANPSGIDWGHSASAYQSCLNVTCFGEN